MSTPVATTDTRIDALEAFIEGRADDDVGVRIDLFADAGGGFVNLVKSQVLAASNGD